MACACGGGGGERRTPVTCALRDRAAVTPAFLEMAREQRGAQMGGTPLKDRARERLAKRAFWNRSRAIRGPRVDRLAVMPHPTLGSFPAGGSHIRQLSSGLASLAVSMCSRPQLTLTPRARAPRVCPGTSR